MVRCLKMAGFKILHAMFINILSNKMLKILGDSYYVYSLLYNNNKTGVGSHVFGSLFTPVFIELFTHVSDEIFIEQMVGLVVQVTQVFVPVFDGIFIEIIVGIVWSSYSSNCSSIIR